jgi:mono/diheme cytochrome c family protein
MSPGESQTMPNIPASAEPQAGRRPVPIWLMFLLFPLLYWGMVYFDQHGGWFDKQVYGPYRSTEELFTMQPPAPGGEQLMLGKKLFHDNCAVCHMDTGVGNPGNGCPPLAGSEWVSAPGAARIVRIVSKGLTGPIQVKGQTWSTGTMLPIGDQLPGDEKEKSEKIAAIVSYIRNEFGNKASPITPEHVAAIRAKIASRTANFSVPDVMASPENE